MKKANHSYLCSKSVVDDAIGAMKPCQVVVVVVGWMVGWLGSLGNEQTRQSIKSNAENKHGDWTSMQASICRSTLLPPDHLNEPRLARRRRRLRRRRRRWLWDGTSRQRSVYAQFDAQHTSLAPLFHLYAMQSNSNMLIAINNNFYYYLLLTTTTNNYY